METVLATRKNENNDGGLVQCNSNNAGDHPKEILLIDQLII